MSGTLQAMDYLSCFFRSYFIGAAYNPRGLQNIGFCYAIEPALAKIYGPGPALREARLRYVDRYNCHPFFTPMLLGIFLRMELDIVQGGQNKCFLESLKDTTANTLSGIGDSVFNGTLLCTWALTASCCILAGQPLLALSVTLTGLVLLQLFKLGTFVLGLRKGMSVLYFLRRLDLINHGDIFKCVNAVLLALFLWLIMPDKEIVAPGFALAYLVAAGACVGRIHMPRVMLIMFLLALIIALHKAGLFGIIPSFLAGG
ncbi:PTS system mannose/fructose/sorbose family transporter subunit IID [Desulfovibrio sp. OttesenSCG-928-A18]|nr:PTS system mannose/fructose/sorbose family transporter subunit IID [Desulfovibrio sp. OttesenSCG-928-A18]